MLCDGITEGRWIDDLDNVWTDSKADNIAIEYSFPESVGHGRYFFSIHGGIQFDHGFDTDNRPNAKNNHVHWLSEKELEALLKKYLSRKTQACSYIQIL